MPALPAWPSSLALRVDEPESLLQSRLGLRADRRRGRLAVLEEDYRRDRLDPEALRERGLLVDVHVDELEVAVRLLHDPVEHGRHRVTRPAPFGPEVDDQDRKSTRLNSSHVKISYAVF